MKLTIKILVILAFLINTGFSNEIKYKLYTANMNFTSEKTLEFDIFLMNVNGSKEELKYAFGQYVFNINPKFANSGTLTYSIIKSGLPESMMPSSSSVSENQLRLSINRINSDFESLPVIPNSKPGLLIARMKLETTSERFLKDNFDLEWSNGENNIKTKIATVVENKEVEINDFRNHFVKLDNYDTSVENKTGVSSKFSLAQNYPNPFNPTTVISYSLTENGFTSVKVYDITGKVVATLVNENLNAGRYEVQFNGSNFASGFYYYKVTSGKFSAMNRMLLIK